MTNRTKDLKTIRPIIPTALVNDSMSKDEQFQNKTLRPIIKMQSELLFSLTKHMDYIENVIHKDMKFRNSLKGMIIGQFTVEEYALYILNSSALNKRMMNIVKERFITNIQLFQPAMAEAI